MPRRGGVAPPGRPSITPSGSRQNHRAPSRTAWARRPTPLHPAMRPVGAGLPRPVPPSITPSGSRQNHRSPSRTAGARRPTPLHPAMRPVGAGLPRPVHPVDNTVQFAAKPSCAITHRRGEETYAPTDVLAVWMRANNTSADSSPASCATNRPSNARLSTACRSRPARARFAATVASSSATTDSRRSTSATMRCCSERGGRAITVLEDWSRFSPGLPAP